MIFLSAFGIVLSFLSGSIPTALMIGRVKGIDIRQHGSGNIGATNAMRVLGPGLGIACLVVDVLKGFIPATLFSAKGLGWGPANLHDVNWMLILGLAAILGHVFSPWVNFRGGKGVATSLGVFLAAAPLPVLICLAIGLLLIFGTGYMSLASITGAVLLPILVIALPPGGERSVPLILISALIGAFIVWRHRDNVKRLLAGNENKIFRKKTGGGTAA